MLSKRVFPEANIGGFSYADASVALFIQIDAILRPTDRVLDFGAGRGEQILDTPIEYRRRLFNLKGRCAHVEGCDVDKAVLSNPFLDSAEIVPVGGKLPYPDDHFDIIYSRFVFEHIAEPEAVAQELLRVLKPGGVIATLTPNKYGYIAMAASAVPNSLHVRLLKRIQPRRKAVDVFPTVYKLNTPRAIQRAFGPRAEVFPVFFSGEPGYYFGSLLIYRVWVLIHRLLPRRLQPLLIVFIRKR